MNQTFKLLGDLYHSVIRHENSIQTNKDKHQVEDSKTKLNTTMKEVKEHLKKE